MGEGTNTLARRKKSPLSKKNNFKTKKTNKEQTEDVEGDSLGSSSSSVRISDTARVGGISSGRYRDGARYFVLGANFFIVFAGY